MGKLNRLLALSSFLLLTWAFTSLPALALTYTTTKITSNNYTNSEPQINQYGQLVWQGFDGKDDEIFTYRNGVVTQLTQNGFSDNKPQINGTGDIVWAGYDGKDYEIYLYHNNSISQLTNNNYNDYDPQINNNGQIVWYGDDGQDYEIYIYENGAAKSLTSNQYNDYNPQINQNGDIVWYGYDDNDYEIFLFHNNSTFKVTNNNYNDYSPLINNSGQIVWYGLDGLDYEIYTSTNNVINRLTFNTSNDMRPKISDSGDIVWYMNDGNDNEIYLYHNNSISKITDNDNHDYDPRINKNGQVVWRTFDGQDYEVYTYLNNVTTNITYDSYNDYSPQLNDDGSIVYYKSMGSTSEIFLAQPSQPNPYRYDFSYYYGDNSGDNFSGYFYDTPGLYDAGQVIHQTGGYYVISSVSSGDFDISYKDTAYIKSYYDGDTKKMSNTLYESPGYKQVDTSIKINNLLSTSGYLGYAYDPSVPVADAFFGDAEVTYHFSANESVNFMAAYISNLPYWTQPNSYPGSCAEVAAGILLSFWDRNGYDNLITTNWQMFWPDNTNSVASYVGYIGMLANNMGYPISPSGGTFTSNIGSGIDTYAEDRGYDNFSCTYYLNTRTERSNNWEKFKDAINAGHPVMLNVQWSAGGHSTVGRGYWNDGKVATNFGWGTDFDNVQLDWNRKSGGDDYYKAYINNMIDVYYSTTGGSTYSGVSLAASLEVSLGDHYYSGYARPMPVMGSDFSALSMAPPSVNTPAEHYHGFNGRRMYVMGSDWSRIQVIHEEEKSIR